MRREGFRSDLQPRLLVLALFCLTSTNGQIYTGINTICIHKDNCTVPGHDCLGYQYGSKTFKVCRCQADNQGGINCATECPTGAGAVCNGHGECRLSTATCACTTGWQGNNCTAECPMGSEYPCNFQGDCLQEGDHSSKCECYAGFRGTNCTIECQGGATAPCTNHGNCEVDGTCTCLGGWRGPKCDIECPGGALLPCNGHGTCQSDATCLCNAMYRGPDCCMECPSLLGVPCAGRGLCQVRDDVTCNAQFYLSNPAPTAVNPNPAKCACNRGFRGAECQIECFGGASRECSGHGTCLHDGSCQCSLGWVGLACNIECPGSTGQHRDQEDRDQVTCSGHGSCAGIPTGTGNTTCGGGCYQIAPGAPAKCNCLNGLPSVISGYEGEGCEISVYSKLVRVSSASVQEPHVKIALRVDNLARSTFTDAQQTLFIKATAITLGITPEGVILEGIEDVKGPDLPTDGATKYMATAARRLLQTLGVQQSVITVRVKAGSNDETGDLAAKLTKRVQEGQLRQTLNSVGLTGLAVTVEGVATEYQTVSSIIFRSPDYLIALLPAGLVCLISVLVGLVNMLTKRLQLKNELRSKMDSNIARISLVPGPSAPQMSQRSYNRNVQPVYNRNVQPAQMDDPF